MLCPLPLPQGKICDAVPWAVIEVLSPDDTLARTRDRFADYAQMGVGQLILMDPEEYTAYRFQAGSPLQTVTTHIPLPTGSVPFDSEELFGQLRAKLGPTP